MTRKVSLLPTARHITEANFRGSQEKIVGANGEINSGSTTEFLSRVVELSHMISNGEMFTDVSHTQNPEEPEINLEVAYHDREQWMEIGSGLAAELQERLLRDGFMRTLYARAEVAEGALPRIRVRTPNVRAIVSHGPGMVAPQFVRDRYLVIDEFTIGANPRVMELEIHQGSGDVLEDKFYEAQEAILVGEDKTVMNSVRAASGIYNAPTYFSGALTPTIVAGLNRAVSEWNLPATNLVFAQDLLEDMRVSTGFSTWFDPITKYELVQTGRIGSLLGLNLLTDGLREPSLKVLTAGEMFCSAAPEFFGAYTDRGPVQSDPRDSWDDGVAAKGWYVREHISSVLANAKAVAYAKRV